MCTKPADPLAAALTGQAGTFWDIIAERGKTQHNIYQGFCLLPGNKFYCYFYEDGHRVPYTWGLHDVAPPLGIAANLKPWQLQDSVLTLQSTMKFKVKFTTSDTVRFAAVDHTNSFVLARSRRPDPDPTVPPPPPDPGQLRQLRQGLGMVVASADPINAALFSRLFSDPLAAVLAGPAGVYWDIIAERGESQGTPGLVEGFYFLPTNQFYHYNYFGGYGQRTLMNVGRPDMTPADPNMKA